MRHIIFTNSIFAIFMILAFMNIAKATDINMIKQETTLEECTQAMINGVLHLKSKSDYQAHYYFYDNAMYYVLPLILGGDSAKLTCEKYISE